MKDPSPHKICQHGVLQSKCEKQPKLNEHFDDTTEDVVTLCQTEDDYKYKILRVSVEETDVSIVEASCCCNIKISPIRFASCNLHTDTSKTGISLFVHKIDISQYVLLLAGNRLKNQVGLQQEEACWLEAASLHAGPIISDICLEEDTNFNANDQKKFLEKHDKKSRRLWFLWQSGKPRGTLPGKNEGRCGCVGGCNFFGNNVNGAVFFKLDYLDAGQEEKEGRLFGSPEGWQNTEFDEEDDAFVEYQGSPKTVQRHNSWAGRGQSPKFRRIQSYKSARTSRGDTSRSNIQTYATFPINVKQKVLGGASAWSVPDNFQKTSISIENDRRESLRSTSVEESQFDRQRLPSDGSFYSCTSGLEASVSSRPPSIMSLDSFTSAIETSEQPLFALQCEDFQKQFILLPSVLLSKYRSHLAQIQCENWLENQYLTPQLTRKFSLMQNLKAIDHIPRTCPKRLEFVPRYTAYYHTLLARKITGVSDASMPDVERRPGLKREVSFSENDSDKISGKMDSLKKRRWKAEINNESLQFLSSSKRPTPNIECGQLSSDTSIVRTEGFVNIMLSPLLLEAVHRYSGSIAEQINSLHPCTILDKIHVRSLNLSQKKYKMDQILPDMSSKKKESQQNIFISVPDVNVCFLQALTSERGVSTISLAPASSDSELSDTMQANYHPNPSLSLLAVRLNGFSGQIIYHNQRNASLAKCMRDKLEETTEEHVNSNPNIPQSTTLETKKCDTKNEGNKLAGRFNLEQVQFQFSRLCNKSDVESSHTTAIPPKCSKVDFIYSSRNIIQYSKDFNVKSLKKEEVVIFVMLESGMDNIALMIGNCAKLKSGEKLKHQVLSSKKSGHNRTQSAPAQLLSKITQSDVIDAPRPSFQHALHENYSEQVLESIVVEKQPGIPLSPLTRKDDSASSITSSLSAASRSNSTGNLTDIESEGEDEVDAQPLLARRSQETGRVGKALTPSITTKEDSQKPIHVLHHESDVVANFKCIWFNCASPSSVKPVPENYHLHNNLLTTGIPAVSSWMPGAEKVRGALAQLQNDYRRRFYSVSSCIMALGLPEKNKMLGTHNIVSKSSEESKYLQREYSSQLIFHLRRQLIGTRKHKVLTALSDVSAIPSTEDLSSGIMALSRQWKCLLGVTDEEFRPAGLLKRPVVGRGVLTERDRAILMKTENRKSQDETLLGADFEALRDVVSPGNTLYSISDLPSPKASSSITSVSTSGSENVPLTSKARVKRRKATSQKQEVEQSLYSWFSSPAASPRSSQHDASVLDRQERTLPTVTWATPMKDEEEDLFGQMVSQPTSGKQIADEKIIFKSFFLGMGFLQPSDEFSSCSDKTFSLLVKLRCLRLDISEGKLDCLRKIKVEIPQVVTSESMNNTPSFIFQNFETKVNIKSSPLVNNPKKYAEEKFYGKDKHHLDSTPQKPSSITRSAYVKISCHSATQSINLSLIRLLLQVADMVDILGENYDGIKAGKISPSDVVNVKDAGEVKTASENQKCWRIMFQVSDLYSTLPSGYTPLTREGSDQLQEHKIDIEGSSNQVKRRQLSRTLSSPKDIRFISSKWSRDPPKLKVVVVIMLQKLKCVATLGELCLNTDMSSISFCACHKVEKQQGTLVKRASVEACCRKVVSSSVSGHLQKARLVLSELGNQDGTVVSCVLNTSHGMYSCVNKREDVKRSIVISLGAIDVDIPQHPVALHCMMTRSSKTLSKQLSEIQSQRSVMRTFSSLERSSLVELSRDKDDGDAGIVGDVPPVQISKDDIDVTDSGFPCDDNKLQPIKEFPQMSITVVLQGFSIGASLLPSLKVEYKIGMVSSFGKTGKENSFKLDMPQHHLSFTSKVKSFDSSIPASTSIHLPRVDISGDLDHINTSTSNKREITSVRGKRHLKIVADIGTLNQNLSTDLLNHLIFIQKGFMKEVNDVLQRVSGESQPVPLWRTASTDNVDTDDEDNVFLIFSFALNLKGIKITATTPSSTAVRLETGSVNLEVSNNEPVIKKEIPSNIENNDRRKAKVFVKADVDLTLSLVQFLKDQLLGDINDFQQLAFFNTHVGIRNCLQGREKSEEKETLLISVVKPFVYVQPVAFDKAVLLYLNYKNAYSYWNEQRMSLNEDVQFATQAVFEKLPQPHPTAQLSALLFLQLTVSELGICLPLHNLNQEQPLITSQGPGDINMAMVVTMEEMLLTCCSSASFVSKGNFTQFCLRFAEKFDVKQSDWKPLKREGILINSCKVSNGTYEICSRTIREPYANDMTKAGKMVMSLMWKMCGVDVHCDTEIGKRLKALGQTLTAVTGDSDIANLESVAEDSDDQQLPEYTKDKDVEQEESEDEYFDETDSKPRDFNNGKPQNLEKEMWRQARKVNELRRRADVDTKSLKAETEILQELEIAVFNEFRRDVKRKIEKQSQRSLFSLNEVRRPSTTRHNIKSTSSMRRNLIKQKSQNRAGKDEVDFGDSSEMVDLGDGLKPHRLLTSLPLDTSFSSPHEQKRVMTRREKLSPSPKRKYLPLVDSALDQVQRPPPANIQHSVSFSSQKSTVVQQDLDFDLEVTVNIESGKCVFHPNDDTKVGTTEPRLYAARLHEVLKTSVSTGQRSRSKTGGKQHDEHPDSSIILLPGVESRVHYSSVTNSDGTLTVSHSSDSLLSSKKVGKHASLYVSLLVQPLPEEMLLRPAILDFIDKALNPIVASIGVDDQADMKSIHSEGGVDPTASSFISSSTTEYSSFPVDIVVVAKVQPSSIRISCLPTSRVECLMKIPSLDIAYSSKPSPNKTINKSGIRDDTLGSQRSQSLDSGAVRSYDSGGISFTMCLSRFSLCIYHPYGKQHPVASKTTSAPEEHDNLSPRARINIAQPQPISGKKDALSLCLEYVKFNLSRRRFGDVMTTNARKEQDKHGSQDEMSVESSTLVRVSGICDFGSTTFTYDMRRLQEIMDFPKCWHKRGLLSRLFLGKEGTYATKSGSVAQAGDATDGVTKVHPSFSKTPEKPAVPASVSGHRRNMSTPLPGILPFLSSPGLLGTLPRTHSTHNKADVRSTPVNTPRDQVFAFDEVDSPPSCSSTLSNSPTAKWETVVVLAVSLSRLDVSTNMANVMGKTSWSTSDLRASGNLRLTNFGERTLRSKMSIRQSTWESRGGIAGGHVELQDISSYVNVNERLGSELEHSCNVRFRYCESRIDYMGTCILMGNVSAFRISLSDDWITNLAKCPSSDDELFKESTCGTEHAKATVYLHGTLHWKNMGLVICRSTTSDLIKMANKIKRFFTEQASNSVRMLSSVNYPPPVDGDAVSSLANPLNQPPVEKMEKQQNKDGLKYQHWSKVLCKISGLKTEVLPSPLPEKGTIVGGTLEMSCWEVSLACFNGLNFRSQTWVLFSTSQPSVSYSSKVASVEKSCQVRRARSIQKLSFQLGTRAPSPKTSDKQEIAHMGMICKVQRGRRNPPSMGSSVPEWLSYVSSVSNVPQTGPGDVSPPPQPQSPRLKSAEGDTSMSTRRRNKSISSGYKHEHESEAIFGLPSFKVDLTTDHDQPVRVYISSGDKLTESWPLQTPSSPHIVECSLESHFYDSLYVTMDVGLILFLHEMIQAYMKENENAQAAAATASSTSSDEPDAPHTPSEDENTANVGQRKKIRQFRSKAWKLEPTVRFLSWAGRRMEGVNIDWVLEKLGFEHARLTIPKWVQRGAMDPMDRFLSILLYRLLLAVQENEAK